MEQIKEVLKEHDIAAVVVLHAPGYSEFLLRIDPSYSCASIIPPNIRFKAKLEDFGGHKAERNHIINCTTNMMHHLSTVTGECALQLLDISEALDKEVGAIHSKGNLTSSSELDN